jgi:imidazolonepropionase-like amidohydrolase
MLILSNVATLYDGASAEPSSVHHGVDVHVEGGRIAAVRPHAAEPRGERVTRVDASGLTATPGLVDCHGHACVVGLADRHLEATNRPEWLLLVEKVLHRTLVEGGVTTTRDVGGAPHLVKRLVDDGVVIGPRMKVAICVLSTTAGHADFRGTDRCHDTVSRLFPPMPGRPSSIVDSPWDCRKRVRELVGCGADLIKICTSPGIASPTDRLEHREFTAEEVEAITDEAAARGLRVVAHAHGRSGIELAIRHGVSDIQHVSYLDEPLADLAARKGCAVTPTSWVIHELLTAEGLSPFVMEKARLAAEAHARAVGVARAAGLRILGGTDPVVPGMHGRNYMEIAALVRDGLPALQAWLGMTGLAAQEVGQADTGTLRTGQRADLLLWRGDVVAHPALLAPDRLVEVLKDGVAYRGDLPGLPHRTFRDTALGLEGL